MPIDKPYYCIFRPMVSEKANIDNYEYMCDEDYSYNRKNHVMAYHLIIDDLLEILKYIELDESNFSVYSHKIYSLFLRACTEIESNFKGILVKNEYIKRGSTIKTQFDTFTTIKDYYNLNNFLKLSDYSVSIQEKYILKPFENWSMIPANTSLTWYIEYNKVKHNRNENFKNAKLENLLYAISGLHILLYSQYSTYMNSIYDEGNIQFQTPDSIFLGPNIQPQKIMPIRIVASPSFTDEDKYDFDWNNLINDKFVILNFDGD